MKHIITILFSSLLSIVVLQAQRSELPDVVVEYIETNAEEIDLGALETLYDNLLYFNNNPLNLNKVTYSELAQLHLLNDLQINNIIVYRDLLGDFIRLEELQAVPGMDLESIRRILPFIRVTAGSGKSNLWEEILKPGTRTLFTRYERDFPLKSGYKGENPAFEGSPDKLYTRLSWRAGTGFSAGVTMEKDPGEAFFRGSNPHGFDFYSAHLWIHRKEKFVKTIALGDFNVNLGQGLIRHAGFGGGKSAFVMDINKRGKKLIPYSSVDENNFLRGVATELQLSNKLSLMVSASYNKRDASQVMPSDTLETEEERYISSLQTSGLHRTQSEIFNKNSVTQVSTGGALTYKGRRYEVSINGWYDQLGDSLGTKATPDNLYRFSGKNLLNASVDYQYHTGKFLIFGESAVSDNGGHAHIIGALASLHPNLDFGLSARYLTKDYQSLFPNAFAENSRGQNEQGVYMSLIYRISPRWTMSIYQDLWSHPWLRYQVDGPSEGNEQFFRLRYYDRRKFDVHFQIKNKTRNVNTIQEDNRYLVQPETRRNMRMHMAYPLSKSVEWRMRVELSQFLRDGEPISKGYLLYHDINFKPLGTPLSFTTRLAYYQTDNYDSRIYAYESNILYAFSIPAYYSTGIRGYFNARWRVARNLTLEGRYAITYRPLDDEISSSYNKVEGNKIHEVKAQMRLRF